MSIVRLVFLGTPEISVRSVSCLHADEHYEIVGIVTQPDRPAGRKMKLQPSPVKVWAQDKNIEVLSPESINTQEVLDKINSWGAEAAVVVAFGQILSQKFLDLFPDRVVNLHASLLPRWRGAAPIQRAIMAGDGETGISLQKVVKKLDAGDVLGERRFKLTDDLDARSVMDKMGKLGCELLSLDFMDYLRGNLSAVPQDESQVNYAKKIEKSEARVNWQRSAREIFNQIRGLTLGPGTYCLNGEKKLKIHRAEVIDEQTVGQGGTVSRIEGEAIIVDCQRGKLRLLTVQPESKPVMNVKDFLKGNPIAEGTRFG